MHNVIRITYPFLLVSVFARQLCLPIPAVFFLMTAGALAARGELRFAFVLACSTLGCLAADLIWFQAGRRWGSRIIRLLCSLTADPRFCIRRAKTSFERWGLPSVTVVKFLPGLDAITPPLAGAEGASRTIFLAYDVVGSLLWSSVYAGVGYCFADSVDSVAALIGRFSGVLVFGIGIPLILYVGWRLISLARMIHALHLRRISPSELYARLESDAKIAIIDLLGFEDEESNPSLPGAIRLDPASLRRRMRLVLPAEMEIILYCSSVREITSARVALALRKKGIPRVWILEGGLKSWIKEGYPVTTNLPNPKDRAAELGIQVIEGYS
jgi:membrane protein DedA with SNARE-associated domain/rhodanese-related sulfurtransferase